MIPVLRQRAGDADHNARLAPETIRELREAGFFRILQPPRFAGYGMRPSVLWEVTRHLGRGCGSTAFIVSLLGVHAWIVGMFEPRAQAEVFHGGARYDCIKPEHRGEARKFGHTHRWMAISSPANGAMRPESILRIGSSPQSRCRPRSGESGGTDRACSGRRFLHRLRHLEGRGRAWDGQQGCRPSQCLRSALSHARLERRGNRQVSRRRCQRWSSLPTFRGQSRPVVRGAGRGCRMRRGRLFYRRDETAQPTSQAAMGADRAWQLRFANPHGAFASHPLTPTKSTMLRRPAGPRPECRHPGAPSSRRGDHIARTALSGGRKGLFRRLAVAGWLPAGNACRARASETFTRWQRIGACSRSLHASSTAAYSWGWTSIERIDVRQNFLLPRTGAALEHARRNVPDHPRSHLLSCSRPRGYVSGAGQGRVHRLRTGGHALAGACRFAAPGRRHPAANHAAAGPHIDVDISSGAGMDGTLRSPCPALSWVSASRG